MVSENFMHNNAEKVVPLTEKDVIEFVTGRFSSVKKSKKIRDLVEFQAMNKYMLMAHNQEKLKILGNLVASHKKISLSEILEQYEYHLSLALKKEPTDKSHSNVIMHIFGYFSKDFSPAEKDLFSELLCQFREHKITIGKLLAEIHRLIYRFNKTYLASQTYFLLYSDKRPGVLFAILNENSPK